MTGKQPWNKGLTRGTDVRVDAQAKTLIARDLPLRRLLFKRVVWY
jgi:hypothetical protein